MKKAILLFIMSVTLLSCSSDKEATIINQESSIDTYITRTFPDSLVIRNNGSNRVVMSRNTDADSLSFGDSLYFYYAGYVFTSAPSSLFATNIEELGTKFAITNPDYSPMKILFTENCMVPGLVNGLYGTREGEHSIIIFSAKYGFYNDIVYNIPKLSALLYEVFIWKVIKNSSK